MHWLALIISGFLEALFPLLILKTESFTHLVYTPILALAVVIGVGLIRYAMSGIPLAVAYLVWTAMGILGTSLVGIVVLDEPVTVLKLVSLVAIIVAVSGLRVSSAEAKSPG